MRKKVLIDFETSSSGLDCLVVRCKMLSIFAACSRSRPSNSMCLWGCRRKSSKKSSSILFESVVRALRGCDNSIFEQKGGQIFNFEFEFITFLAIENVPLEIMAIPSRLQQ